MEIVQKSGSNKAVYNFLDDKLKYSIKDSSGKNTFSIDYGSIPYEDFSEIEQKNAWYRNVGILWCLLGLVITSMRFFEDGVLSVSMWVSIGFVCLLVYWFTKTSYTIINTESGRIFIIQDKKHDEVLSRIDEKRKKQWNSWYNTLNLENSPNNEIGKFKWLMDRGVINETEFNEKVTEITNFHEVEHPSQNESPRTLN